MTEALGNLFIVVVFPGFCFTVFLGLLVSWAVRKVSALVQWRVGPPVTQPFWDVLKLMGKEVLIPVQANRTVFVAAPIVGMAGILLLSVLLLRTCITQSNTIGDIIVAAYLLVLPSLALILGGSASGSPHAALGTSREMKLVMGYELPLVLAIIVVVIKAGGQIGLAEISQARPVLSVSGAIAFLASLFCVQAKLGFVPFDIAESETELAGGVLIEYSGALLAIWKIMQAAMLVALPLFLVVVFLGGFGAGGWPIVWGLLKGILVIVLIVLIKNTNPRVRIDQAMRFFWVYCGLAMVLAVILAVTGKMLDAAWL